MVKQIVSFFYTNPSNTLFSHTDFIGTHLIVPAEATYSSTTPVTHMINFRVHVFVLVIFHMEAKHYHFLI